MVYNEKVKQSIDAVGIYMEPACLRMLVLGFGSGLPLLLLFGSLSFWLREAGLDLKTIGHIYWIGLIFGFKWAFAPFIDRLQLPILYKFGQRRSWLLLSQFAITGAILGIAASDPKISLQTTVLFALMLAFFSATQDIALDAFRIEMQTMEKQAALAATYQAGYRIAMLWAGAGVLAIAGSADVPNVDVYQPKSWQFAYFVMGLSMLPVMVTLLFCPNSPHHIRPQQPQWGNLVPWFVETVIAPFNDFIKRYKHHALLLLLLIATYRISDIVMGVMANPLYIDLGFSKIEIAEISKVYGVVMTLFGAFIGGSLTLRYGVLRILFLGGLLSAASNLLFTWLSTQGHSLTALTIAISFDNTASGLATAAFIAYLSSLTNIQFSATQYALFSSIMLLLPKWVAGFSGAVVEQVGYGMFFIYTALLGIPVLLLILVVARLQPLHQKP